MIGSCVCGAIEFEATEIAGVVYNCHCSRCRKSHGAAFATFAFANRQSLRFNRGKDLLKEYESTGGIRTFCGQCGSRLMNYAKEGGPYLSIALACIDSPHGEKPVAEVFVKSKVPWQALNRDVPHYETYPPDMV